VIHPKRLLAKSGRFGAEAPPPQTIRKHTYEVMRAAECLVDVTGESQLEALGLPHSWLDRLRREIKVAALLHDLGKANDHFQGIVRGERGRDQPQGIRHEVLSYLLAGTSEIRKWVHPNLAHPHSIELVLWAVAGHHRKFPPDSAPDGCGASMKVHLHHDDFHAALKLGTRDLGLGEPPHFRPDHPLTSIKLTRLGGIFGNLREARERAEALMISLPGKERRFVALLKACLICADVAGSIGRRGSESIIDWIPKAFSRVPSAQELLSIVESRLGPGASPYQFQNDVADRTERVVFVKAGCGSGKTLSAYLWAARLAQRTGRDRRLFFCYPTTGTATEGYRDYLKDPTLDAELVHGRADVDKVMLADLGRSGVDGTMETIGDLGDDEPDRCDVAGKDRSGLAKVDSADALEQWSTPLVSCTVDTVLGLVQNNRRGLYAWPSIARSAFVFDEIHSYDEKLFRALLRFLADVPGVPCLLMTASLPSQRLAQLATVMAASGQVLDPVPGPVVLESVRRYRRVASSSIDAAWDEAIRVHSQGGKVLWVANTVNSVLALAADDRATAMQGLLYHSRFRYRDRVERHRDVIEAFRRPVGRAAFAITSQVAEMSLDLSADLLVTHLAPISALIQRLGRLNRRASPDGSSGTRPFFILRPNSSLPYTDEDLDAAELWLKSLGDVELNQADLISHWAAPGNTPGEGDRQNQCVWLDGGFVTEPWPLRQASPGIEVILERDRLGVLARTVRPEEVRIPMPPVPKELNWTSWPELAFCKVPPMDCIEYDERKGARWKI
jgi:CRISPR-associated endonuclease/helicase Cas3